MCLTENQHLCAHYSLNSVAALEPKLGAKASWVSGRPLFGGVVLLVCCGFEAQVVLKMTQSGP